VEREPPAYLRGIRRDGDDKLWHTTVGEIEQYRAAYGIRTDDALGPRPGYGDMTRGDQYRQLDREVRELRPTRAREREMDMGIEL
jgi:hypothetical protein